MIAFIPLARYSAVMIVSSEVDAIHVDSAALSDVGRKRQNNEDAYLLDPEHGLFAVADGMGGHNAGEVASGLAVAALQGALAEAPDAECQGDGECLV